MLKPWTLVFILTLHGAWAQDASEKKKAQEEVLGVFYYGQMFGHVHTSPLKSSNSLTTVGCGHPIKVLKPSRQIDEDWRYVKVGAHKGYLEAKNLLSKQEACFQNKYPKFFNSLNLDLSELYYWGRIYDQYIEGKSSVSKK